LGFSPRRLEVFKILFKSFLTGLALGGWIRFPGTRVWGKPGFGFVEFALRGWEKVLIIRIIPIAREEDVNTTEGYWQFGQTCCLRTRRQME
jgi:hypothetical protein